MSAIFISHSSKDNAVAGELKARLEQQGHRSVFLDFDPEDGIPPGRDWERELYASLVPQPVDFGFDAGADPDAVVLDINWERGTTSFDGTARGRTGVTLAPFIHVSKNDPLALSQGISVASTASHVKSGTPGAVLHGRLLELDMGIGRAPNPLDRDDGIRYRSSIVAVDLLAEDMQKALVNELLPTRGVPLLGLLWVVAPVEHKGVSAALLNFCLWLPVLGCFALRDFDSNYVCIGKWA